MTHELPPKKQPPAPNPAPGCPTCAALAAHVDTLKRAMQYAVWSEMEGPDHQPGRWKPLYASAQPKARAARRAAKADAGR